MKIEALVNIRHNGILYDTGKIFELDDISGNKLIEEGAAKFIENTVAEDEEKLLKDFTITELKEYAVNLGLELKSTKKDSILQEIEEYEKSLEK